NDREKFGTYNRDGFTGLDYADQRYYASTLGRFNTPDPYGGSASVASPRSWNRYSYVLGDPVNKSDRMGLDVDGDCDWDGRTLTCPAGGEGGGGVGGGPTYCDVFPTAPDCGGPIGGGENDQGSGGAAED